MKKTATDYKTETRDRSPALVAAWAVSIAALLVFAAAVAFAARDGSPRRDKTSYRAVTEAAELDSLVSSLQASGDYPLLVDLRDGKDYEAGHAPGFLNVPNARDGEPFATWIAPYRRDKTIVLVCYGGNRSARAFERLVIEGFTRVIDFTPGYETYERQRGGDYAPEKGVCDCPK